MKRRTFVHLAAAGSAATVATPVTGLFAAPAGRPPRATRAIFTDPPAVEPVTGYLTTFTPATGGKPGSGTFTLVFAGVLWKGVKGSPETAANATDGRLTVRREAAAEGARYRIEQQRRHGNRLNRLRADVRCSGPHDEIAEWTLVSEFLDSPDGEPVEGLTLRETGSVRDGKVRIDDGRNAATLVARRPVASAWCLAGVLASGACRETPFAFDHLHELSALRPEQELRYAGDIRVPTAGGDAAMRQYIHTGRGTVPTHYLLDADGRVQLITQSWLNWALVRAE